MSDAPPAELRDLKVDDPVVMISDYGRRYTIWKVDHVTNTQVHTSCCKFGRDHGNQIGGDKWNGRHLTLAPEAFALARKQMATRAWTQQKLEFTKQSVVKARRLADLTEKALRDAGEWSDDDAG